MNSIRQFTKIYYLAVTCNCKSVKVDREIIFKKIGGGGNAVFLVAGSVSSKPNYFYRWPNTIDIAVY